MTRRKVAWITVITVLLLAALATRSALQVKQDDNLLAFLPANDPDVKHFEALNKLFGGIDVALIGVDAGPGQSVFSTDFLSRLAHTTDELSDTRGIDGVVTLGNVTDFVADEEQGGIITGPLVGAIPKTPQGLVALRAKVMARSQVVGTFVSRDATATLLYCFLAHGSNPRRVANAIRKVVDKHFPHHTRYWGGNPFISSYIFDTTQRDMRQLTPWAVLAMVIVMMLAFRDFIGTCLALLSTSFGIVFAIGLMALFDEPINLVLSSMPVILFAVGSAYGIHVLAHFYVHIRARQAELPDENEDARRAAAVLGTLRSTGPTVIAAGLTTVVSLLSFLAMDQRPMRIFGLFTGLGVLATLILSVTFIPAVARLIKLRARGPVGPSFLIERILLPFVKGTLRHRRVAGATLGVVAVVALIAVLHVENRIDATNLFEAGSPPDRADRFLAKHFGGSQFLQLHVHGDFDDPLVLRELTYLGDRLRFFPHVTSVVHIGNVIGRVNEAMVGQRRIPDTRAKIQTLQVFALGEAAVKQLLADKNHQALIQVKLGTSDAEVLEKLLTQIERWVGQGVLRSYRATSVATSPAAQARLQLMVLARIRAALIAEGVSLSASQQRALTTALKAKAPTLDRHPIVARLRHFLRSKECTAEFPKTLADGRDPAQTIATAVVALGKPPRHRPTGDEPSPWEKKLTATIAMALGQADNKSETVEDVLLSIETPLDEFYASEAARQHTTALLHHAGLVLPKDPGVTQRARDAIAAALLDLHVMRVPLPLPLPRARHAAATPTATQNPATPTAATTPANAARPAVTFTLTPRVNGLPTIHRALARSALHNQGYSLASALIPVILIMALLFRSLIAALLLATPTLLTLLIIYGSMGLSGIRLDIGTAMIASIILGAGVDYGVHLLAAWRDPEGRAEVAAENAVRTTGPAIWTNALTVSVGFFILTIGHARPLQNVGSLTALAMLTAAFATFWAIPVLARRTSYGKLTATADTPEASSPASNLSGETGVQLPDAIVRPTSSVSGRKS
ncbi:MAG: MMPL family transporter [Deltaproteobacteria bacterium]|nr:MMPL family transporter [Deltaproteobacteria bacterium]